MDSRTNFVMMDTGRPAVEVIEHFGKYDVLLARPVLSFDTYVRVSLGSPAEMREFWEIWDLMGVRHMSSSPADRIR